MVAVLFGTPSIAQNGWQRATIAGLSAAALSGCALVADIEDAELASTGGASGVGGGATGYASVVLVDQPVGYWRLGESSGPQAIDSSGKGLDGVYYSGAAPGAPGAIPNDPDTAALFDGNDDYVGMGDVLDFTGTASFTIEAWVKLDAQPASGAFHGIASKEEDTSGRQGYTLYVKGQDGTNAVYFVRYVNGAESYAIGPAIAPGAFSHVVATYEGLSGSMLLYVDGAEVASSITTDGLVERTGSFLIGARGIYDIFGHFGGTLDEVAVYDHALSKFRVMAHYDAGK